MKVLVTGATGFIGNYVIQELLNHGVKVIATSSNINTAKEKSWFSKVNYIEHNIYNTNTENLFLKFNSPDIAIHLAWGNLNNFKSQDHVDIELPAHYLFLENLIKNGLNNLTCIGTCLEYGLQEGCLNEEMDSNPIIAYPTAKNILRQKLEELSKSYPISLKWVRLFYMFGQGQSSKSILQLLDKAIQNNEPEFNMSFGEQIRDYLPVTTVSKNIVKFALQQKTEGIINCCSGKQITIKELVENYLKEKNKTIKLNLGFYPYTDYEPMKFWGDEKKSKKILNDYMSTER